MQIRVREMRHSYSGKPFIIPHSQLLVIHNLLPRAGLSSCSSSKAVELGLRVTDSNLPLQNGSALPHLLAARRRAKGLVWIRTSAHSDHRCLACSGPSSGTTPTHTQQSPP